MSCTQKQKAVAVKQNGNEFRINEHTFRLSINGTDTDNRIDADHLYTKKVTNRAAARMSHQSCSEQA